MRRPKPRLSPREVIVLALIEAGQLGDLEIFDAEIEAWMQEGGPLPARLRKVLGTEVRARLEVCA